MVHEPYQLCRSFDVRPESVREARSFIRQAAADAGADPDEAALLTGELAANAVVHAHTGFQVRVPIGRDAFRVEIVNDAPEMIAALREPTVESGRGLHIVEAVALSWGTEAYAREKVVWFELPTT
jgi:anti-sigma regulatory factor (Ser/Thr protein kinase)